MTEWRNRIVGTGNEDPEQLLANPGNWRIHPKSQQDALSGVLDQVGWVDQIIVNQQTGHVVDGHLRVSLALRRKEPTVPVVYVDLSPDEEKLILATLDPISAMATADREQLDALLREVQASDAAVEKMLAELALENGVDLGKRQVEDAEPQDDKAEELRAKFGVEPGQLWQLGEHRLICGDCTDRSVVEHLMDGKRAILFATDPPYLVGYDGKNHPHTSSRRDNNKDWSASYGDVLWDEGDASCELYDAFIAVAIDVAIEKNAAWYCWHSPRRQAVIESIWNKHGAFVHQQIIWVKNRPVPTRSWYTWQHEPCFFGWIRGNKPPRVANDHLSNVWHIDTVKPGTKTLHPTSKPIEVFTIPMLQHTREGDICYEPFCGSGSQIIAGEQLGRRVYACELSPGYVAVTIQRWVDVTGGEPVLSKNMTSKNERESSVTASY